MLSDPVRRVYVAGLERRTMSNAHPKPSLLWWIMITAAGGGVVFILIVTVRSIANVLREPSLPPPVIASADFPEDEPASQAAAAQPPAIIVSAPRSPQPAAAPPQPAAQPRRSDPSTDFKQMIRNEQEKQQIYQALREQARANPGQLGTLSEAEIQKLEQAGETGDRGFP